MTTVATVDGRVAELVVTNHDEIEQIYVAVDHRGASIAAALLTHGEQVIAAKHSHAFLAVVAANGRARRFYARNGWYDAGPFDDLPWTPNGEACHRYDKPLVPCGERSPREPAHDDDQVGKGCSRRPALGTLVSPKSG